MHHTRSLKKTGLLSLITIVISSAALAQKAAASSAPQASGYNTVVIALVGVIGLLAFVIWLLGRVLIVLGKQVVKKNNTTKALPVLLFAGLLITSERSSAQVVEAAAVKAVSSYGGLSSSTFYIMISVLVTEIVIIFFLSFLIKGFCAELLPAKIPAIAKESKFSLWWKKIDKKLTRSVPVEKEADVMLDHDYDGIRELDNALPPWWKYGFYITIGVAIVYLLNFEVLGYGKNPTQEYNDEMARARIQKEIYEANNKDKIDENNVPMADAAGLAKAKEIFEAKCFACHGKLGEGGAGPNLTDDYWLHKGSLNDIYHTIKNGYPDKGMQSWSTEYSPKEISFLASYVKTLHDTNPPNAKGPQGDIYTDEPTSSGTPADSSLSEKKSVTKTTPVKTTSN